MRTIADACAACDPLAAKLIVRDIQAWLFKLSTIIQKAIVPQ